MAITSPLIAPVPKYHRIKKAIAARIVEGVWASGSAIPTEPALCHEFGVSRNTVRKAVSDLIHEGKLRTMQGKGTFVATPKLEERFVQRAFGLYEDMERRGLALATTVLRQDLVPAPPEVAAGLWLAPGEPVHAIERLRAVQDERILVSTNHIPASLCPGLERADLSTGSLYHLLRARYEVVIARGERRIEAVAAGPREARLLDIALASPLLRLTSVAYLPDGRPFEYSWAYQRGDRACIDVEFLPASDDLSGDDGPCPRS